MYFQTSSDCFRILAKILYGTRCFAFYSLNCLPPPYLYFLQMRCYAGRLLYFITLGVFSRRQSLPFTRLSHKIRHKKSAAVRRFLFTSPLFIFYPLGFLQSQKLLQKRIRLFVRLRVSFFNFRELLIRHIHSL